MDKQEIAKKIWGEWENALVYQKKLDLKDTAEQCVDFYEGRQWPQATERTKNFPRPVLNIIKFIVNGKRANILSSKIKIIYKPLTYEGKDNETAIKKANNFTNFATHIKKELKQEELDSRVVTDALKKGTGILHYFWDVDVKSGLAQFSGGLNGQVIDVLDIAFANPKQKDEQKQKWIIIQSRENVETLKEKAKKYGANNIELELITADDDSEKNYDEEEQEGEKYATVLTRYFRKNGEVYYIKTTKNMVIQPETPLTPDANRIELKYDEEKEEFNEDKEAVDIDEPDLSSFKFTYYPIVVVPYEEREKSIFGIGEIEQLIPVQKAINFDYAMMQMAGQNMGFPKLTVRPRALQGKSIKNIPGEIITDYSPNFDGIKYLNPPAFSNTPLTVSDKMFDMTRTLTGATEVANGEVLGANMSGSAIVALQNQAKVPIEFIQKMYWRSHEKIAKIWEQFFKACYRFDTQYFTDDESKKLEIFNGTNYTNTEFSTSIDVGAGSAYSESMSIALLENALNRKDINFDEFIELYPDSAMPFKSELKKMREKKLLPPEISEQIMSNPQIYQYVMQIIQKANTPVDASQLNML